MSRAGRMSRAGLTLFALGLSLGCQAIASLPGLGGHGTEAPGAIASQATGSLTLRLRVPEEVLPDYQVATIPGGTATLTLTLSNAARIGAPRVTNITLVGGQTLYTVTLPSLPVGDGYTLEAEAKNGSGTRIAYSNRLEATAADPALNQPTSSNPYALPPLAFTVKSGANNVGIGLRILPVGGSAAADAPGTVSGSAQVMAGYLRTLTVSPTVAVNAGYVVSATLNTSALVSGSKLRADMNDLHVLYWEGTRYVELTREIENPNTASSTIRFRLQKAIAAAGSDASYRLAYGNNLAGSAPTHAGAIYDYYESFEYATSALPQHDWYTVKGSGTMVTSTARARTGSSSLRLDSTVGDYLKDVQTPYAFPTNFALRGYYYDDGDATLHNWINPNVGEETQGGVVGVTSVVSATKYAYNLPPSVWTATALNRANGWHQFEMRRFNGVMEYRIDGTQVATASDVRSFSTIYLRCGNVSTTYSSIADWDDLSVRQYVSPEPAVAVGTEGAL